jgi:single-strand DNA-binding protein
MIILTIEGNLTADPELSYPPNGDPVTNFRVLHTARRRNDAGEWVDGRTTAVDVTVWRGLAERVVEGLRRGDTVIVTGENPRADAYLGNELSPRV